jgi:hypothetical protein
LEDETQGYFCESLDLGFPAVREVVSNRPDQDGTFDRTALMGSRQVSASIVAVAGAGARIDQVAAMFAPFMSPAARPVLHYVLDRDDEPERVLTLRAAGYSWPIVGASTRAIQLQFVAPDPIARDLDTDTTTAWAGLSGPSGRTYPLTFPRTYPAGGGGAVTGHIVTTGDVDVFPVLTIYGPITGAQVAITGPSDNFLVPFLAGYTIGAGQFVVVDTKAKTALVGGDPSQSVITQIDWANVNWPAIAPHVTYFLTLAGSGTTGVSQVVATWQDGYLT